jgi:predicted Zn-dependent protease
MPDIVATWEDLTLDRINQEMESGQRTLGETRPDVDGVTLHTSYVVLVRRYKDDSLSDLNTRLICLHELGHALGILRHSLYEDDIMAPHISHTRTNGDLTERDKHYMRLLYCDDAPAPTFTKAAARSTTKRAHWKQRHHGARTARNKRARSA